MFWQKWYLSNKNLIIFKSFTYFSREWVGASVFQAPSGWLTEWVPLTCHILIRGGLTLCWPPCPHHLPCGLKEQWNNCLFDRSRKNGSTYSEEHSINTMMRDGSKCSILFRHLKKKKKRVKWVRHESKVKDEKTNKMGEKGWRELLLGRKLAKEASLESWERKLPCISWSDSSYRIRTWCVWSF